jgi:hypothetical protein
MALIVILSRICRVLFPGSEDEAGRDNQTERTHKTLQQRNERRVSYIYGLFNDAVNVSDCIWRRIVRGLLNGESENMWKEPIVA